MRRVIEQDWPWLVSLVVALVGWASGVWFWGTPTTGFDAIDQWFPPLEAGVVAIPLMVLTGVALAGRRQRAAAWIGWAIASLVVAYVANFSHFGGFCIDPGEDTCVVTWASRLAVVVALVLAVTLGWSVYRLRLARRAG